MEPATWPQQNEKGFRNIGGWAELYCQPKPRVSKCIQKKHYSVKEDVLCEEIQKYKVI